jgi:hypothetical protein
MARKAVRKTKKKPAPPSRSAGATQRVGRMSGGVVAGRDINIKRDFAGRDKTTIINRPQTAPIHTPQQFVGELKKLSAQVAELKALAALTPAQARRVEVIEADLQEALEEAQKPQPLAERINTTLTTARATMDNLAGGLASAAGLGAALGGLAKLAAKVFGG